LRIAECNELVEQGFSPALKAIISGFSQLRVTPAAKAGTRGSLAGLKACSTLSRRKILEDFLL
jgi:hypothetical protein